MIQALSNKKYDPTESESDFKRFWSKVKKTKKCWTWRGHIGSSGYGDFSFNLKTVKAHIWIYHKTVSKLFYGDIIKHSCANKSCVNVAHMSVSNQSKNLYLNSKVIESGCRITTSKLMNTGYGRISYAGRQWLNHRLAWTLEVGNIPAGMMVDHKCRNRACFETSHLRIVTPAINVSENSLSPTALNKLKTHCKNGHEFSKENTKIVKSRGKPCRQCRTCVKNYYLKNKDTLWKI